MRKLCSKCGREDVHFCKAEIHLESSSPVCIDCCDKSSNKSIQEIVEWWSKLSEDERLSHGNLREVLSQYFIPSHGVKYDIDVFVDYRKFIKGNH